MKPLAISPCFLVGFPCEYTLPSDEKVALWSLSEKDTTNQCLSAAWLVWVLHLYQICCFIPLAELLGLWSACNVQLVFQFVCLSIHSSLLAVQEWILMARVGTLSDRNFKENMRWTTLGGSVLQGILKKRPWHLSNTLMFLIFHFA